MVCSRALFIYSFQFKENLISHEGIIQGLKDYMEDYETSLKEKGIEIRHRVRQTYQGAVQYTKDIIDDIKEAASGAYEKAENATMYAKEKLGDAKDMAENAYEASKPFAADAVNYSLDAAEKAKEAYENAKPKVVEAAKYTKEKLVDAKDMAEDAYGILQTYCCRCCRLHRGSC